MGSDTGRPEHVLVIWQRFLPYHVARLGRLNEWLASAGRRLTAVEVAPQDASYRFPVDGTGSGPFRRITVFPGRSYHELSAGQVHRSVLEVLDQERPDVIFAPATPFPEGMAAVTHRWRSTCKLILMDDAWEGSDLRGILTRFAKRMIHRGVDGIFAPAPSHRSYFEKIGFPTESIVYGVDAVDNNFYALHADRVRNTAPEWRTRLGLPEDYFIYVGRLLPRKGLETLIEAYRGYRKKAGPAPWGLVLVGDGPHRDTVEALAKDVPGVSLIGARFGEECCACYALASAAVVPSLRDPWALVVNEAMASGLPVLVSRGCGSAKALVREAENGWTFSPGDADELLVLMRRIAGLPRELRRAMGLRSQFLLADWGLDRFVNGVQCALKLSRRPQVGLLTLLAGWLWKGRIREN
jgi:glycosyltransferase involved in cell wall biosynthesis